MPAGFRRKRAREQQRVRVDGNGLRREVAGEQGLGEAELAALMEQLDEHAAQLERQRRVGFAELPGDKAELRRIFRLAEQLAAAVTDIVVLGSGDLALGISALAAALTQAAPAASSLDRDAPRLHVFDRFDPDRFTALLGSLDLERTLFNVVSATGEELETMSHFLIVRDHLLRDLGAVAYQEHVVVTTRAGEGALRQIVNDEGFRALVLPDEADEASALLSPPALFPLACAGIDVAAVAAGASAMMERCRGAAPGIRPAHLLAMAMQMAPAGLHVIAPAAGALGGLAAWIARRTRGGTVSADPATTARATSAPGTGARPVTLILATQAESATLEIPAAYRDLESVGYLGGQQLGALIAHERTANEMALWGAGQLTITMELPAVTAHVLGQVVALTEAAVALAHPTADLPSQGAAAARLAYGLVGRPGYEAERAAVQRLSARREDRYVA